MSVSSGGRRKLACLAALVVAGCSSSGTRTSSPTSAAQPASSATAVKLTGPAARCGPPQRADATLRTLAGPGGASLPVAEVGHGSTVALFLHQTDGDGLCGFWPYAAWLTGKFPVRAALVDLCSFGSAKCSGRFDNDQVAQVAFAAGKVRQGATRFVLVGASMGGALALASANRTHADAVVDLSGPTQWFHADGAPAAKALRVPALIAGSRTDTSINYAALRGVYSSITAKPKRFVDGDGAHGWNLLSASPDPPTWTPLATTVGNWIVGKYS